MIRFALFSVVFEWIARYTFKNWEKTESEILLRIISCNVIIWFLIVLYYLQK